MTPSDNDLRAALRHGEADSADGLDVDAIITAGRDRAAQRRVRLLSGAAVVAVVAAAGVGGALLANGSGQDTAGQKRNGPTSQAGHGNIAPSGQASAAGCPSTVPNVTGRNGRIGNAAGGSGQLFARPVDQLVVCSYPEGGAATTPTSIVLRGSQADLVRTSLENAAKFRPAINCPTIIRADERRLAIYGVTSSGKRLAAVTTTINAVPCRVIVTNGTTTRYDWSPSAAVQALLKTVTPGPSLAPGVPGASSGAGGSGSSSGSSGARGSSSVNLPSGTTARSGTGSPTKHGAPIHN